MQRNKFIKGSALVALLMLGSGCEQVGIGYSTVEADQAAVVYQQLPQFMGGGLTGHIVAPGTSEFIMPWQSLIKISTGIRELTWEKQDKLKTRTRDGNMLILEVMVRYRVDIAADKLLKLVQLVSVDDQGVEAMVSAVARSDVRLYFNKLNTEQFLDRDAVEKIQFELEKAMSTRLEPYGIIIELFKLKDFHFQPEYQNLLDDIQEANETTSKIEQKKATVKALKQKRIKEAQEEINRLVNQAKGELQMATIRGEQYFVQRKNEAEEIMAKGKAEVAGMEARLKALSGPGGANMLKIEIVKGLLKSDPKFVVLNQGKSKDSQMNVQKVDTNQLLQQLGLIESMQNKTNGSNRPQPSENIPSPISKDSEMK
jgi:regulator of protease activity HflC (stomatin/prohibitin superfamily)